MDKRPKRRKDKYNPYTLHTENGKYYISFSDANNYHQKIEVTQEVFESFNKFELEDISNMNEYDRHIEHSDIYQDNLNERSIQIIESFEDRFENVQDVFELHKAINQLPEAQKRRLKKYYFDEMSFKEIADEEGCNYQCVQRSVYRATAKIKNILKNFKF
jgi:RNA polymerase sigma-70 factor (ECF subfamily)